MLLSANKYKAQRLCYLFVVLLKACMPSYAEYSLPLAEYMLSMSRVKPTVAESTPSPLLDICHPCVAHWINEVPDLNPGESQTV